MLEASLVVNAHSRKGQDVFDTTCFNLEVACVTPCSTDVATNPYDLAATVRCSVAGGVPMVIVGGGDGPLSGVDEIVGSTPRSR